MYNLLCHLNMKQIYLILLSNMLKTICLEEMHREEPRDYRLLGSSWSRTAETFKFHPSGFLVDSPDAIGKWQYLSLD